MTMRRHVILFAAAALVVLVVVSACGPPGAEPPGQRSEASPGARLYGLHCEGCHGRDGRKGEPGTRLTDAAGKPEAELRAAIEQGRGVMPAWKDRLSDEQITALIEHVRRFGGRGGGG
jgi:mono/diheme cytochrome c family protein